MENVRTDCCLSIFGSITYQPATSTTQYIIGFSCKAFIFPPAIVVLWILGTDLAMQGLCARIGGTAVPFRSRRGTKSRYAVRRKRVSSTLDSDRGFNVGQTVSKWAKGANLKTDVRIEEFLGDR